MKYSKDGVVCFDESTHTYTNTINGKTLTSVTTLISKFKNKFDAEYHAGVIALRTGVSKEDVLNQWAEKSKFSNEMGTHIHKIFEDYALGLPYKDSGLYKKEKVAISFIRDFYDTGRLKPIESELIVYNDYIAGQIDNISISKDNSIFIKDYKTNNEISKKSYGKNMIGSTVPDANFYHYSLQTDIYKNLYKQLYNKDVKGTYIVHIDEYKYNLIPTLNDIYKQFDLSKYGIF